MSNTPHTHLFTEVDRTSDPDFFVRFMDEAQKPAAIQTSKQLMLLVGADARRTDSRNDERHRLDENLGAQAFG